MPTNHTEHYSLSQWEAEDKVLRTDFNEDNVKIDRALAAADRRADGLEQSLANQAGQIARLGNCQIYTAQYTGEGKSPITHTFPHKPWLITVTCLEGGTMIFWPGLPSLPENRYVTFTWEGNIVTWSGPLIEGMASQGRHYQIIALLDMSE